MSEQDEQEAIDRAAATCVAWTGHFGEKSEVCRRGVNYDELADNSKAGIALRLPCIPMWREGIKKVRCDQYEATGEERAWSQSKLAQAQANDAFAFIVVARDRILAIDGVRIGDQGHVDCPRCEETDGIHFELMQGRGGVPAVRAKCSTDGCVQWIE